MKKIEAYIKSEKLKDIIKKLKETNAPGFSYHNITGHGKEEKVKLKGEPIFGPPTLIIEDILPRTKVEVICNDEDVEKIIEVIHEGSSTKNPGDGMLFVSPITDAYRLRIKEKILRIE